MKQLVFNAILNGVVFMFLWSITSLVITYGKSDHNFYSPSNNSDSYGYALCEIDPLNETCKK